MVYRARYFVTNQKTSTVIGGRKMGAAVVYLTATDIDSLHALAARLGIPRHRFVNRSNFPHYPLIGGDISKIILRGKSRLDEVEMKTPEEIAVILSDCYDANNNWIYATKNN